MGEAFRSERYSYSPIADASTMAERIMQFSPASDAEALKLLRASFPNQPLSMRVAALNLLMRRHAPKSGQAYRPR
jgi:hypothetical protein